MRNFIIGAVIGSILIAVGIGMSTGKIKILGSQKNSDTATTTISTVVPIEITEAKVEEKKDGVMYSIVAPKITNAPILQKNIDDYVLGFRKSMTQSAQEIGFNGASNEYTLNISYKVIRNDQKVVVIKMAAYEFTGGAHGNPSFAFFQYDVEKKRMIGEEEIFVNKKDSNLIALVSEALTKKKEFSFEDGGVTKSVFFDFDEDRQKFMTNLAESGNVAFAEKGIMFKYGAYAIGPYVIGEPEVVLPYTQLETFLTPYAKNIIK